MSAGVGPSLPAAFAGQLRLPYLYGNRLVVTDAQVFDGILMLAAGPRGVAELLGSVHRTDVLVMLRRSSARESLEAMLANPSFHSSAESIGWDPATVEQLRDDWVAAIDHRRVNSAPWRKIDFAGELSSRLSAGPLPSPDAAALSGLTVRSDARHAVEASELDADERRAVFNWWNGAYMDVLALQHDSVWITTLSPGAALAEDGVVPESTLAIPEVIVEMLSSMSGSEFAKLVSDATPVLAKLRSRKRWIDRLRLALLVLDAGAVARPLTEFVALTARLATFALLIVSALVGREGLAGLPPVWAIPLAVLLIVAQVPFLDLLRFLRLFRRSSRAVMRTPGWHA